MSVNPFLGIPSSLVIYAYKEQSATAEINNLWNVNSMEFDKVNSKKIMPLFKEEL